jgi:4-hydroxybenzoate polyprenyltransferase
MSVAAPDAKGVQMLHDIQDKPADMRSDASASVTDTARLARIMRTRWQAMVILTGVLLTVAGVTLPSGAVLIAGLLVALVGIFCPVTRAEKGQRQGGEPGGYWPWTPWRR